MANNPPEIGNDSFRDIRDLYVPLGAKDSYLNSDWSLLFSNIIEIDPQSPDIMRELVVEFSGQGAVYRDGIKLENNDRLIGESIQLLILPDDGNRIADITLDGESILENLTNHYLTISRYGTLNISFVPETEASLTIKGAENHTLTSWYKEGTQAKIDILPEENWELYTLNFNGNDVTDHISGNTYTTPSLSGQNHLEIILKASDINTGIDQPLTTPSRRITLRKSGNTVEILNLDPSEPITLHTPDGATIYRGTLHTHTLPPAVYILHTSRETLKFTL